MKATFQKASVTPVATLSAESLQRARATVEDFVRSYFPLHGLPLDAFLNFMDVLIFIEASLYECDERVEAEVEHGKTEKADEVAGVRDALASAARKDPVFSELLSFLEAQGLLDDAVATELACGLAYWQLEQKIGELGSDVAVCIEEVQKAMRRKSFDYRVLNLVLYQLQEVPYDHAMLDFLCEAELLVEIEDDLKDYSKDVLRKSFNIYRCYVHAYGEQAPARMASFIEAVEASYLAKRSVALNKEQLQQHIARNEEQQSAGPAMAPCNGCWAIPVPILDEPRTRMLASACDGVLPPLFVKASAGGASELSSSRRHRSRSPRISLPGRAAHSQLTQACTVTGVGGEK
mmetsp:Transcript_10518/g.19053  ORF Transcript_10518/g.19053 Transcript_10518/m.19053 type:complete len:348 (+) Transcript_10518:176-1219(+)